jgi:hypothetical protein
MISDGDLIQMFVQDSMVGKDILLANPLLQAMNLGGNNQLVCKKEGVLVSLSFADGHPVFAVKFDSPYCELISQTLFEAGFLPVDDIQDSNFKRQTKQILQYFPYKLPENYTPHCTKAMSLWKIWWKYVKRVRNQPIPTALVIRKRHQWYPIKDIFVTEGLLYIQTLQAQLTLHSDDLTFWLNKTACSLRESPRYQCKSSRTRVNSPEQTRPLQQRGLLPQRAY